MKLNKDCNHTTTQPQPALTFGQEMLTRMEDIHSAIYEAGPAGLVSLIEAMIAAEPSTREQLMIRAEQFCDLDELGVFEKILNDFEGPSPVHCAWFEEPCGTFTLFSRRAMNLRAYPAN